MYFLQFNLVVSFDLDTNIKKIKGPSKIVDSCVILGVFNIKNWKGPSKIVDPCAILGIFNIKKIRGLPINIGFKIEMGQVRWTFSIKKWDK